jgi:outer membrane protein TolC
MIATIGKDILPPILARHPSVRYGFEGQYREQAKSAASMASVMPIILLLMVVLIVLTFRSFLQTLVVLLLLPLSYTGVIWGHFFHEKPISFFSVLGIIALIGIMVNDALVFVAAFNQNLKEGRPFRTALFDAGLSRFRPIILTSLTTIAGLAPLILNRSFQAQFLIPMAVSVAYGLAIATALNLIVLPVLLAVVNDIKRFAFWFWNDKKLSPESMEPAVQELDWEPHDTLPQPERGGRGPGAGVVGVLALLFFAGVGASPARAQYSSREPTAAVAAQSDTLSLDLALTEALQNNLGLQIQRISRDQAENRAKPGVAGLLPNVQASGGYTYGINNARLEFADPSVPGIEQNGAASRNTVANIGLSYALTGSAPFKTFEALKTQALAAGLQTELAMENLAVQVVAAYFQAVRSTQQLDAIRELVEVSSERYERASVREAVGSGSGLELLNAEVAMNSDRVLLFEAQQALTEARHALNLLLGRAVDAPLLVSRTVLLEEVMDQAALRAAMESDNARLQAASINERLSLLDWQVAQASFWPTLQVEAGYGYSLSDQDASFVISNRNLGFSAGVNLAIPLFTGGTRRVAAQQAEMGYQSSLLQTEDTRRQLEAEWLNAWSSYEHALRILALQATSVATAKANLERSRERFESGLLDGTAYREAQVQWVQARNAQSNARFQAKLAEIEVLRLAGKL